MNLKIVTLILGTLTVMTFLSCTPKTIEPVVIQEVIKEEVVEKTPANPCRTLGDLSGYDREQTETAYVLYKDQIKLKNYQQAFPLWKTAYYNAPAANGSIKYQFEDGIALYKNFFEGTTDSTLMQTYVDSIMSIYDKRIECFGEPAYIAGRKAFDYYYYFPDFTTEENIYKLFKKAIDAKGKKVDYFVINPFTKLLSDKVVNEETSLDEGRFYANIIWEALKYGTESGENKEAWEIINDYAPARLENLEGIADFYDCDYYDKKYMAIYHNNPEDCDVINTAYRRLAWGGCSKSDSSMITLQNAKDENCYTPPPPPGPLRLAYDAYQEGKFREAVNLFSEFVQNTDDKEKKFKYNLLIAKIYYGDIKNFSKSRDFAYKAADIDPNSGEPYLLIGKLYASSGPLCGPGRGWDSQIVTWPAIDMFEKAKSDPLVAEEANKLIRTYWQYMPDKGDIFQRTFKIGSEFKVGCWINRTTTIRSSN